MVLKVRMILLLMVMSLVGYSQMVVYQMPIGFDSDAQAFITAAAITDATQQGAINTLVVDLKANNLWTKMKAVYPFVGGSASSHKWNLKDPRDLDAAFRIVWNGGVTHNSNGIQGNGTNGYGDTKLNPTITLSLNSTHISMYEHTRGTINGTFGALTITNNPMLLINNYTDNNTYWGLNTLAEQYITTVNSNTNGFYIANRTASDLCKLFRNGSNIGTSTIGSVSLPNVNMYVAARNGTVSYANNIVSTVTIGDGLTDLDVSNLSTIISAFNTTLR